ncbi:hypothetical protein PAEPH01_0270 [Pancytospora epiphaga]|nr:hypothetical protein PAEPH01_0270 [Pancytospora epiphaga]
MSTGFSLLAAASYLGLISALRNAYKGSSDSDSSSTFNNEVAMFSKNVIFSNDPGFSDNLIYQDTTVETRFTIVFPNHKREEPIKAMVEYPCFISKKAGCPGSCTPYSEFGTVSAFNVPISVQNAKGIFSNDRGYDIAVASINKAIETTVDYSNFDSMVPFLYNADVVSGIRCCTFDESFVTFFLNSFNAYLDNRKSEDVILDETGLLYSKKQCVKTGLVDLICNCDKFCQFPDACGLLNEIISDSRLTLFVIGFIRHLLCQIEEYHKKCVLKCNLKAFTTYESYYLTLKTSLEAILTLLVRSHNSRYNLLNAKHIVTIATVPYLQSSTDTPTVQIPSRTMFVIPKTAINGHLIVDF